MMAEKVQLLRLNGFLSEAKWFIQLVTENDCRLEASFWYFKGLGEW